MSQIGVTLKIVVAVCFVLLLWVGCASASTIIVSKTSPACTSGDDYFTSIQAAVDSAKEGDEVVVCPGTYVENIVVDKSVSICSYAGASDTVIEAKNIDDNIINITTNKVTIGGFTIKNTEANGIYLDAAVGCNLSGNNIYSTQNGIRLFLSDRNQIYLNTANLNNNSGISLEDSNNNLISNNIANSKQYNGIELNLSNNNIIIENKASNNTQAAIGLLNSSNNTIRGNMANSSYYGIGLQSSNDNTIIDNNASNNMEGGIALFESSTNSIVRNNLIDNYYSGIYLESSSDNSITKNTLQSNALSGIFLTASNNNTIEKNKAFNNLFGIYLESSSGNIIKESTLKSINTNIKNRDSSNNNIIVQNSISNSDKGIDIWGSDNCTIKDNIVKLNGEGVNLMTSNNNSIEKNIFSNEHFDLHLSHSGYNSIRYNVMQSSNLLTDESNHNIIAKNIISGDITGLQVDSSNNNVIENNIIKLNHMGVALIQSSKRNLVTNNNITLNYRGFNLINTTENSIYHNDIIENIDNLVWVDDNESLNNNWYHPDLLEGNYWSDYNGIDINGDGIGDTEIPHPDSSFDNHPFMNESGWLTFLVSPEYWDFGAVYQGEIVQKTFTMQNAFVYNKGKSDLTLLSITSDSEVVNISYKELPMKVPKGSSRIFNVTLDTTGLEGNILRSIEIKSDDSITPNKTILIYGVVKLPTHEVKIKNIGFQSELIKGQISSFNIVVENCGDFREEDLTVELRGDGKSLEKTTIELLAAHMIKSTMVTWNTGNASLGLHDITVEVLTKNKRPLTNLSVVVSVIPPSKAKTLIVTNLKRLWEVENELIELSRHPSVKGIILDVCEDPRCSEAYNVWDSHLTSENANNVAKAIKDVIDATREVYTNVEYILIVGNDEVIPFYRIQDKSLESYVGCYGLYDEKDYIETYEQLKRTTSVGSAFNENQFLTDDFYADFESEELPEGFEGELNISDRSIGRLVETPEEISKTIEVFSKKGEILEPNRIFITSYDFMNDAGESCTSIWGTLSTPVFMGKGIEEKGTYSETSEIVKELLNKSNNIIAIFQHADHHEFDIEDAHGYITSNIISNSPADLNGSIVYSMGCHAGLNVPGDEKFSYDLAQAFMDKGVLAYVAPTGWGIGGVVTEAGHERLMHYFTKHLCEGMDAGTALMLAKQDYYGYDFDFDYIDQKVVSTAVLYGLPMYGVDTEAETERIVKAMSMEKPCNTFTFRPDYSEIETPVGTYSSVDETLSSPGKPVLPKLIWPYLMDGKMLHGITLKNARYVLIENTALPYEEYVVSIAGGYKQPVLTGETWNPSAFFKVNTIGNRQYIILITGQFKKTGWTIKGGQKVNIGDLRRYNELTFDLHLSAPTDEKESPEITVSYVNASCIQVNATDGSGVQKIVIAYTDKKGIWESFDIVPETSACELEAEIELEDAKEYLVQVVDVYGNVAVEDNDERYYSTGEGTGK